MHRLTDAKTGDPISLTAAAAEIYGMRRARDQLISSSLVGEPGWDILLALCAEHPGKLAMTSVSQRVGVPASTIRRWIAALESAGLVERMVSPVGEPIFLSLTEEGCRTMERCLKSMLRASHR